MSSSTRLSVKRKLSFEYDFSGAIAAKDLLEFNDYLHSLLEDNHIKNVIILNELADFVETYQDNILINNNKEIHQISIEYVLATINELLDGDSDTY